MRRALVIASLASAILASIAACDDDRKKIPLPPPSAAPNPSSVVDTLGIDAGVLGDGIDPPAPAGDLKAEIERFTTLDACVAERAKLDPLVGDALRAIGYDTFLRDACRQLEAAHDKKREVCDKIDSSALKKQCRSWVAMIAQVPDQCPLDLEGAPARGRVPTCLAVAGKDPRLCVAEPRTAQRATCEALVLRDDAKCDVLLAIDRPGCKREHARWRTLLASPLEGLPKLPPPRGKLVVHGSDGTADPAEPETNLAAEYARGAVVAGSRSRTRVELGAVMDLDPLRVGGSPNRRVRVALAVVFEQSPTSAKDEPKPSLERFEIELPGEPAIVCSPGAGGTGRCELKLGTARADKTRGGEVAIALGGTVASGTRTYKIEYEGATFVRDFVTEEIGGPRLLPPAHPTVRTPGGWPDGGNPLFLP
jgi:hypothetical protein